LNNPEHGLEDYMSAAKAAKATWYMSQLEKGKETGTVHIQAALGFANPVWSNTIKKIFPGAHIERAKAPAHAWAYCSKEDTRVEGPVTYGVPPAQRNVKGDLKIRNAELIAKGPAKAVEDGDIHLKDFLKLKANIDAYNAETKKLQELPALTN